MYVMYVSYVFKNAYSSPCFLALVSETLKKTVCKKNVPGIMQNNTTTILGCAAPRFGEREREISQDGHNFAKWEGCNFCARFFFVEFFIVVRESFNR